MGNEEEMTWGGDMRGHGEGRWATRRGHGQWGGDMGHEEGTWKGDIQRGGIKRGTFSHSIM